MKESNSKKPNLMFPLLLKRADSSSQNDRSRAEGFIIGKDGKPVLDPKKTPEKIALEGDPNVSFEHFGEFWRKIHGERIVYKDELEDNHCDGVCSYYQIQRVAAAPSSAFPPPYPVMLDSNGQMEEHLHDKLPEYKRPSADGLVYWAAPTLSDLMPVGNSKKQEKKISWDSVLFLRNFVGSLCTEYIIKPSQKIGKVPPVCTVKIHYGMKNQEETQERLLNMHSDFIMEGDLARKLIGRFAYIFNINKSENEPFYCGPEGVAIDAISVTYFDDMADCEEYYSSDEYRAVVAKEAEFLDMDRVEWWTGIVYPLILSQHEVRTDKSSKPDLG